MTNTQNHNLMRPLPLLPLLSACATHPHYSTPAVPLADAWSNAPPLSGTAKAAAQWWRGFADPVLDRLVDDALLHNLTIEGAAARLEAANAGARAARAAALPSIIYGSEAGVRRQSLSDPAVRTFAQFPGYARTNERFGLSMAASWELDLFGRLAAERRAARADADAARADLAGASLTVAAEIAITYLDARELEARLAVSAARIRTLAELDRLVRQRYAAGIAARLETDQVAADLATARAAIPALETAREAALNRIDVLTGRQPGAAAASLGAGQIPETPAIATPDPPAALIRRRPDLVAAERAVAAADARVAAAIAGYYPRITLSGLVGLLAGGIGGLFAEQSIEAAGGGVVSGQMFDFGRTRAGVDGARARTREAVARYRLNALGAAAEVEDGLFAVKRRRTEARERATSAAALARARDAARLAYRAGAVSLIEALDAERRLQAAQEGAATARAATARAAVTLYRALGAGA